MVEFLQNEMVYYIICGILSITILLGISLMSKVKTAVLGNRLSAISILLAIVLTLIYYDIISIKTVIIICLVMIAIGSIIGFYLAKKVKMIQMPQMVALFNGFGGAASAIVGACAMFTYESTFNLATSIMALVIGSLTFTGSLVAAGKLAKIIDGRPIKWKAHEFITSLTLVIILATVIITLIFDLPVLLMMLIALVLSSFFGYAFAIRVGGADMPITISLLNSFSGVAGAIAGMAIGDILLVAVGGIVGASGLLLTQIMCKAMNRHLMDILLGKTSTITKNRKEQENVSEADVIKEDVSLSKVLREAKKVIIVPGYGMALAQAQHLVKQLADRLENNGVEVKYAIHPVAGRMPGHMNVLLAEADVEYDQLYELENINDNFKETDVCIVIGANDVLNPAARDAEGTPIYGMPILNVDEAKHIIICNYDLKPGYAGVENPLYKKESGVSLLLGDAKVTLPQILNELVKDNNDDKEEIISESYIEKLKEAKKAIIVPGYGMALAQAQHLVKQLANKLESNGTEVKYAIHPVAGRMPGHMNVLLAEADVEYDQLHELESINSEFKETDVCIVIGANDVLNPAARDAEGTPIYGMPILNVDEAKHIIICNYDLKPGYAGVENPLYKKESGVSLLLGDAKVTLPQILNELVKDNNDDKEEIISESYIEKLKEAKKAIIVPGYGMALAQAQHLVKQLANKLESNGTEVKYAIHPVAGRMPGHMNVLLAEADVEYDQLHELESINSEFKETDVCIVIGANDVLNPAARDAEGTPIYGMPILNVDEAKHIIICNYDLKPGYAGVENPLYKKESGVSLLLGDAKVTLPQILNELVKDNNDDKE